MSTEYLWHFTFCLEDQIVESTGPDVGRSYGTIKGDGMLLAEHYIGWCISTSIPRETPRLFILVLIYAYMLAMRARRPGSRVSNDQDLSF